MNKPVYLYVTPFFPSPKSWKGGYCLDAAKAIARTNRYDVRVVLSGDGDDYEWDGIKVYRVRRVAAPCGVVPFLLDWLNNIFFRRKLEKVGLRPEVVAICHVNTLGIGHYAAYFRRLNPRVKTIMQIHACYNFHLRSGRLGVLPIHATLLYIYWRYVVERVDILVFVSEMAHRTFGKIFIDVPEGKIIDVRDELWLGKFMRTIHMPPHSVVYNGIDYSLFYPGHHTRKGFVIGCIGNFQYFKGQLTLLKAIKKLRNDIPDLTVRLIGSNVGATGTIDECKRYVVENGLDDIVSFEKEVDHRKMADVYRYFDLFVLPSRLEGFGCVYAESCACGVPFIACRGTGIEEVIDEDDKWKWLANPNDEDDVARKIMAYYHNRWVQQLKIDLDLNAIWNRFISQML